MTYLKSKTFWASVAIVALETAQAIQALPLTDNQAHILAIALAFLVAVNRMLKK